MEASHQRSRLWSDLTIPASATSRTYPALSTAEHDARLESAPRETCGLRPGAWRRRCSRRPTCCAIACAEVRVEGISTTASTEDIRGHYVKVNGTRISPTMYIGEGYPRLCVHTACACSLEYTYLLPLLAERGFHAYALDLPGHFRSSSGRTGKPHRYRSTTRRVRVRACEYTRTEEAGDDGDARSAATSRSTMQRIIGARWRRGIPMEGSPRSPTFPSLPA